MQMTGAQIIVECLKEQGVDTVFGYPGGAILNVYDEIYNHPEIKHVLTSHEQGASHMADGYSRSTGKVGVCIATSGPGATNLVTGIGTAYMDSSPIVAITCNVNVSLLGKDSFQEIDIAGITMPITKHNYIVRDVNDLANVIRQAFTIARKGRPGPVLVDVAKDVTAAMAEYEYVEPVMPERVTDTIREEDIDVAVQMIENARQPFVLVGGGAVISGASEELREFVDKIDAPVCDTLMGKGAYDGTSDRYIGMIGMHGSKATTLGHCASDQLVALGTRFSDRVLGNPQTFAGKAKILQFDIDPAEINKNKQVDAYVVGDIKEILKRVNAKLDTMEHRAWRAHVAQLAERFPLVYPDTGLSGPYIIEKIYEMTHGDAMMVTEVGQHQMWAAQFYKYKAPRQLITSGGLGTMGFGLGAAIGAKMANPDKTVINIAGDGCFRMNMNELATAKRQQVAFIEIIINNHVLGMVRQWQTLFYDKHYEGTVLDDFTDFVKISEAMGAEACQVTSREEFDAAFERALQHTGSPFVIDCVIDSDDKVWPMVPAGASIKEAIDEEDFIESQS